MIRHRGVVEHDLVGCASADLVATRKQDERATGLGTGSHIAADRLGQRLTIDLVDPVQLEAQRVARHHAAVEDRRIQRQLGHRAFEIHRLAGIPRRVTEISSRDEKIVNRMVRLDVKQKVGRSDMSPPDANHQFHTYIFLPDPRSRQGDEAVSIVVLPKPTRSMDIMGVQPVID